MRRGMGSPFFAMPLVDLIISAVQKCAKRRTWGDFARSPNGNFPGFAALLVLIALL